MFDRNGDPIVENRVGYSIQLSDVDLSDGELNDNIIELVRLLRENDNEYITTFPIVYNSEEKAA